MTEIHEMKIGGRPASVVFLSALDGRVVGPKEATVAIVRYDDGGIEYAFSDGFRTAAAKETALHQAADKMAPKLEIALRLAFALGRKAISRSKPSASAAVAAIRASLEDTLPKALRKTYVEGGQASVGMLKAAEFNPDQPRDEQGQWTAGGASHARASKDWKHWADNLSRADKRVLDKYQAGVFTRGVDDEPAINEKLRQGYLPKDAERLSDALDKAVAPRDLVLYRGVSDPELKVTSDEYLDKGFMSATFDIEHAGEVYANPEMAQDPQILELHVPKGTRGVAYLDAQDAGSWTGGEAEVLIDRWKEWTKVGERKDAKGRSIVQLKLKQSRNAQLRTAKRTEFKEQKRGSIVFTFNAASQEAIDWADRHSAELIDGITETSREAINNAIADALEHGTDPYDDILEAVGDATRAQLIAHTEVMRAVHEGQREAWRQAEEEGLLTGTERVTWIVTGDDKVCPICEELDGKLRKLDGQYHASGDAYEGPPAHPRCRCTEGLA